MLNSKRDHLIKLKKFKETAEGWSGFSKLGRDGRKQSGTAKRTYDPIVSSDEDKDDSDKSSSVDPVDQSQLDQFKDEYYGVQDLGQDGDELEEDDYNETTLQPKRIANLAY
ncbi:unnamed protein product [Rhizophagus irregularis]|uniref:Uncharacterized protein n=1 Tax=Rhizophagus irregularis TaxID=588596 RepID=A0A915YTL2_9GLOM|nr:unnamed protein product [Rhizophagus irregularis]